MKKLLYSMQSLIWAFEIIVCLVAVLTGIIICSFCRYRPPTEENVYTYSTSVQDGIDGTNSVEGSSGEIMGDGSVPVVPSSPAQ